MPAIEPRDWISLRLRLLISLKIFDRGRAGARKNSAPLPVATALGIRSHCLRQKGRDRDGEYLVMRRHRVVQLRGQLLVSAPAHSLLPRRRRLFEISILRAELAVEPSLPFVREIERGEALTAIC